MGELQNKVITIVSKEEKEGPFGPLVKIKDENNLTYSVYKNKKDGTVSAAWNDMPSISEVVQIGYVEEVKQHPEHGQVTYRTIRNFNKDIGQGVSNYQKQNPKPVNNTMQKEETNWTKIGMIKGMNNLAGSRLAAGAKPEEVLKEVPVYMDIVSQIEQAVDQSLIGPNNPVGDTSWDGLPTIQQGSEDINVDDIPF